MQAILTKVVLPTKAHPVSRIRAACRRKSILVDVPDNLTHMEEAAHRIAARELAERIAIEDERDGRAKDAEGWRAPLVTGSIPGPVVTFAHVRAPKGYEVPPRPASVLEIRTPSGDGGTLVLDQCGNRVAFFDGVMGRVHAAKAYPEVMRLSREPVQGTPAYLKSLRKWNNA